MGSHENNIIPLASVRRERGLAPRDPVIETLLDHRATIVQAAVPLQKSVALLEHDWGPRSRAFWQRQLRALAVVQEAIEPCIELLSGDSSLVLTPSRYEILCPLFETRAALEQATIHITAFLPQCQSHSEKSLRLRQNIVRGMRSLVSNVEEAVQLLETREHR